MLIFGGVVENKNSWDASEIQRWRTAPVEAEGFGERYLIYL